MTQNVQGPGAKVLQKFYTDVAHVFGPDAWDAWPDATRLKVRSHWEWSPRLATLREIKEDVERAFGREGLG
jgi:hypothetical protein